MSDDQPQQRATAIARSIREARELCHQTLHAVSLGRAGRRELHEAVMRYYREMRHLLREHCPEYWEMKRIYSGEVPALNKEVDLVGLNSLDDWQEKTVVVMESVDTPDEQGARKERKIVPLPLEAARETILLLDECLPKLRLTIDVDPPEAHAEEPI